MGLSSMQERFVQTLVGRLVVSAFVVVTLIAVVTANMPATSRLQDLLMTAMHRYIYAAGLDQNWGVFAPDPRRETVDVRARVTFSDGSAATWKVPRRNDVIGGYVDYRWLKWEENVVSPVNREKLGRPFALFVARELASPTRRPVRVQVTNRSFVNQPPGSEERSFVQEGPIYETPITDADLDGAGS